MQRRKTLARRVVFFFVVGVLATTAAAAGTAVFDADISTLSRTSIQSGMEKSSSSKLAFDQTTVTPGPSPTESSSASKTSSSAAQTFTVQVGNGDHKFKPDVIQAAIGDVVEFDFYPQNHSVARAEYQHPCIPYEMTGQGKIKPPKFTIRVNDTSPVFFYCSAPDACTLHGMVGVVNPNATSSLATQRQIAQQASYQLSPGEDFPSEAETPLSSSSPSSTSSPSPPPASNSHGSKLSAGAIAGIAIACVGVVVLGGLLAWFWGRFRGLRDELVRKESTIVRHTSPRSTWLFSGQTPGVPPTLHDHSPASPPDSVPTPMTSHAMPPAYYAEYDAPRGSPRVEYDAGVGRDGVVNRSVSHRSMGGTFDLVPGTGYYTRTHEGDEAYKHATPRTSDMTSPVDPNLVPCGTNAYNLQKLAVTSSARSTDGGRGVSSDGGYVDERLGRSVTLHVNRELGPVEMDDTSTKAPPFV
ncbi:hypothetical protein N0V90_009692 [Kalmusia sp. IMI 367209]|nr:hypothetical protein N0V90_009692 [Kalmusia sp. IMI 367209]